MEATNYKFEYLQEEIKINFNLNGKDKEIILENDYYDFDDYKYFEFENFSMQIEKRQQEIAYSTEFVFSCDLKNGIKLFSRLEESSYNYSYEDCIFEIYKISLDLIKNIKECIVFDVDDNFVYLLFPILVNGYDYEKMNEKINVEGVSYGKVNISLHNIFDDFIKIQKELLN